MTRCADCGAERSADQCPACGLTSAAAEAMLRGRLVRRTAVFLAGSIVFPYSSQIYPPLDLDAMLVFFGVVFFAAVALVVWIDRRARRRGNVEILKRIYFGFIPLPWVLVATLFVNGKLDNSKPEFYSSTVISRFEMRGIVRGSRRLVVRSWREGERVERLAADADDYGRFRDGDGIVVGVMSGALGIPWLYGVYRK
ncbi:MAG TPA: hypothetical protein VHE23_03685 [Candidatus Acidoferrales bacterium]|nr:hypothetical protein [Candidatus Acidoferrales bacterium]